MSGLVERPPIAVPGLPFCRFVRWVVYVPAKGSCERIVHIDFGWKRGVVVNSAVFVIPACPYQRDWTVSRLEAALQGNCVPGACLALGLAS